MKLVLASSSPYRAQMLGQLHLPFDTLSPDIDETPKADEGIDDYVSRLALEKARAVAENCPNSLVIGSDQACTLQGLILGKPADEEAARKQLKYAVATPWIFEPGWPSSIPQRASSEPM